MSKSCVRKILCSLCFFFMDVQGAYPDDPALLIEKVHRISSTSVFEYQQRYGCSCTLALVHMAMNFMQIGVGCSFNPDWSLVIRNLLLGYGFHLDKNFFENHSHYPLPFPGTDSPECTNLKHYSPIRRLDQNEIFRCFKTSPVSKKEGNKILYGGYLISSLDLFLRKKNLRVCADDVCKHDDFSQKSVEDHVNLLNYIAESIFCDRFNELKKLIPFKPKDEKSQSKKILNNTVLSLDKSVLSIFGSADHVPEAVIAMMIDTQSSLCQILA